MTSYNSFKYSSQGICNYVQCIYGQWSQWSTTCGIGQRRRSMQTIRKTIQRVNCNGLPLTCSSAPDIQTRNQQCKFDVIPVHSHISIQHYLSLSYNHSLCLSNLLTSARHMPGLVIVWQVIWLKVLAIHVQYEICYLHPKVFATMFNAFMDNGHNGQQHVV